MSDIPAVDLELAPGLSQAQAILKPRKSRPFYARHPWVLDSAIERIEGPVTDGGVIDLLNDKRKFLARGIYNSKSKIRVRLYTWDPAQGLHDDWLRLKLTQAVEYRRQLGVLEPSDAARIVFSEGDGLSGLIVDRYADYLSIQVNALAMAQRLPVIVEHLQKELRPRGIVVKQERGISAIEGIQLAEGLHYGTLPEGPIFITENQLRYGVDLREGQKTGFYVDQRDNRLAAARYAHDRRVLDMFCYAGGFSMNAVKHGQATNVLAVDVSDKAIALAQENVRLNQLSNIGFQVGDGFETLEQLREKGEKYGLIVLDPPKFARSRSTVDDALRAYHLLNRHAVNLLEPGGILVTCSCSGHVQREDFLQMLSGVAQRTGRDIQILEQRGPSADHPVSATCLESEYLKCFICRVL